MESHLAAILVVDVVGYSSLIERNDAGTLAHFGALIHELIEPGVAGHDGPIGKLLGDATA